MYFQMPGVGPITTDMPLSSTTEDGVIDFYDDGILSVVPTIYDEPIKKSSDGGRARAGPGRRLPEGNSSLAISSENLLERKEVLAGKD